MDIRGGGTPYNGPYGEAPPEKDTFSMLQVYERVGSIWKGRKICHLGLWKGPKELTDEYYIMAL